jgi:SsrA-binding protein
MAKSGASGLISHGTVAQNRKARHDFAIEDDIEAGIMLTGSEVKSLRHGRANITEAYAGRKARMGDGEDATSLEEVWLYNLYIPEYSAASHFSHEPRRPRKLLLHKREVRKLLGALSRDGMSLVPLSIYFNSRGIAKIKLGIAKGKKLHDKRQSIKDRDWDRQKHRLLRDKG